jgi:hypothetical protein
MEDARLVRATQNRLWSAAKIDHPNYRNLTHHVSSALAGRTAWRRRSSFRKGELSGSYPYHD